MIKLMPAEMSAKLTLRKRNKKFNQTKKDAIKDIKSAIKKGKYSTIIWIPDDWNDEDFLLFWNYFTTQGYILQKDFWSDPEIAVKKYQEYSFSSLIISWDIKKGKN
nr:MAG TPA: hypothetical protein [Caudoviricetes sp.]